MSRRNYSNYSKSNNVQNEQLEENLEDQVNPINEPVIEELNERPINTTKIGVVANCDRVYLRSGASKKDDPIVVLEKGQEVEVLLDESTNDFYRVNVNDNSGYCMKNYIRIR